MHRNKITLVFLASFLISFAYGIILTLPLYLTENLKYNLSFSGKVISLGFAGVISSFIIIHLMKSKIKSEILAALGCFIYAFSVFLILSENSTVLLCAGVLFGMGWGMIYTMGPIIVSELSTDASRSRHFSYISAFNMLGSGIAPAITKQLINYNIPLTYAFYLACLLSLIAMFLFGFYRLGKVKKSVVTTSSVKIATDITTILCLMMVFLGACIFSSMMNFQTLIAGHKGLDFSFFYITYTLAVILSRFTLASFISRFERKLVICFLLIMMSASVFLFIYIENNIDYIVPSALLGISYGLVYPLIQAESVSSATTNEERKRILTLFSLFYFVGIYCFPYLYSITISRFGFQFSFIILSIFALTEFLFSTGLLITKRKT